MILAHTWFQSFAFKCLGPETRGFSGSKHIHILSESVFPWRRPSKPQQAWYVGDDNWEKGQCSEDK